MGSLIRRQDIGGTLGGVRETFSSWDNCMSKAYCKWPVIAAIIIGSLILLSVIICVARCICCGAECACCCFRCCAGCCGSGRKSKAAPPPTMPAFGQGVYGAPVNAQYRSYPAPTYEAPQYANFESSSKPANPDSLPAMPGWNEAKKSYVEDNTQAVEMKPLNPAGNQMSPGSAPATPTGRTPGQGYGFPESRPVNAHNGGYAGQESGVYRQDEYQDDRGYGQSYGQGYAAAGDNRSPYQRDAYQQQGYHGNNADYYNDAGYQDQRQQNYAQDTYGQQQSSQYAPSGTTQYGNGSYQRQQPPQQQYHQFERPPQQGWHVTRSPINWKEV